MSVSEDVTSFRSHTPAGSSSTQHVGGTPIGVLVLIVQNQAVADNVSSVTYGGVALSRVRSTQDLTGAGDLGRSYIYLLSQGAPAGDQTLVVTYTSGVEAAIWCITLNGSSEIGVVAHAGSGVTADDPSVTLATPSAYDGVVYAVLYSGLAAAGVITAGSGYALRDGGVPGGHVFDSLSNRAALESGAKSGANVAAGFTTSASDDVALTAVAIESPSITSARMARTGGAFAFQPTFSRASGVFAERPVRLKAAGEFV